MPLCQVTTNVEVSMEVADAFLSEVEATINKILKKPTQYIMATLTRANMRHAGSDEACANVSLHSIGGINSRSNNAFCAEVSALCEKRLGVPAGRVFFQFTDVSPANFGVGSQVFG
ncbi:hypothetical protein ACSSS7_006553 [Eimeria intestinalis]